MVELQIISEFILNNVQYFIIGLTLIFLMALIVFININRSPIYDVSFL